MKKYKLIKEYPDSPKLNSIYEEIKGKCGRGSGRMYKNLEKDGSCLDANDIEPYTELWEEITKKNYEILSFKQNSKITDLWLPSSKGWSKCGYITKFMSTEEILNRPEIYSIYSVKRLSDGEIFTIGDEIKTCVSSNYASIYSFSIVNNYLKIEHTHSFMLNKKVPGTPPGGHLYLISKKKEPLFKTKDGVDIYEGNDYWYITKTFKVFTDKCDSMAGGKVVAHSKVGDIFFSTKKAAEEYILMNKPCLSINDVFSNSSLEQDLNLWYRLRQLVKPRI